MNGFFIFLWLIANVVMIVFIVKAIKTQDEEKKYNRKIWLISLGAAFILLLAIGLTTPSNEDAEDIADIESEEVEEVTTEANEVEETEEIENTEESDELELLRAELKEKYDISEPSKFAKGDATGKWRINTVANSTPPTEYAVDYAKAYMSEGVGTVYYIVNLSLKTTNQFRLSNNILEVYTTEYVDGEEHDASAIGSGMEYSDRFFDMKTGEEFTTEADESAGTADSDDFISAVKDAIDGAVGEGEKITDVTFDGSTLTIKVDMSGADTSLFSAAELAEDRISSITDNILELDDKYYNTWEKITVDFGSIGKITFDKSDVETNGYGKYFDYPYGIFTE